MAKWRPQTRPIQGYELARIHNRIDEIGRGRGRILSGLGMMGGPPSGPSALVQAGQVTTDPGTGKATVTFKTAYPAAPNVVATVLNSGGDLIVCEIEAISPTQFTVSSARIALQGSTGLYTGQGEAHAHSPGTLQAPAHDHAPGTFNVQIPAGTDGSAGTFGVAGVSASSGPFSIAGATASESSHRHPAPADNVEHRHGKELIGGVLVYWVACPTTL
jgi:hypothetical protein